LVARAFELALRLQDTREVLGIDRNHEPGTGEAGTEPGTQEAWNSTRGNAGQRIGTDMAEGVRLLANSNDRDAAGRADGVVAPAGRQ